MKQGPLLKRQFFLQKGVDGAAVSAASGGEVQYVRLHGHPANPGTVLSGQRIALGPGGVLDVVCLAHGGQGLGRIGYTGGLRAAVKRGAENFTYRFEVPRASSPGTEFEVSAWGHDLVPTFHFHIVTV